MAAAVVVTHKLMTYAALAAVVTLVQYILIYMGGRIEINPL
jgi:cation transporter-like permease